MEAPDMDPFSEIASAYDGTFSDLPQVRSIRNRIYSILRKYFRPPGALLDIGCGTGADALHLEGMGFRVTAIDRSRGMLRIAARKAVARHQRIDFVRMPLEQLDGFREGSFDYIISNFGVMNCAGDLPRVLDNCYHLLRDNGMMMLTFMGGTPLWETIAHLLRGNVQRAIHRWNASALYVPVGGQQVLTRYHSIHSLKRIMRQKFILHSVAGIHIITPPPGSHRLADQHAAFFRGLSKLERRLDTIPFFSGLGDHFIMVLERFE